MTECIECERAARRMLLENIETQCPACGAVYALDAEVVDLDALTRPIESGPVVAELPKTPVRRSRAALLSCLAPEDRAKAEHEAETAARWERVRRVVSDLLRYDAAIEMNEKSASSCTSQSNWLRGALAVGAEVYAARPDLRPYQRNPVVFGPGHNGSVGAMSSLMPDFTIIPIDPRTAIRLARLDRTRAVAAAVRKDGQGDRTLPRTLVDGRMAVSLTLEQRIGLEVAPAEVLGNWWRQIQLGHYAAMLAGSSTYGTRALFELEAEWFAVKLEQHPDIEKRALIDAKLTSHEVAHAVDRAMARVHRRQSDRALAALDAFGAVLVEIGSLAREEHGAARADEKTHAVF